MDKLRKPSQISRKLFEKTYRSMSMFSASLKNPAYPPTNLTDFEERLEMVEKDARRRIFGLTYDQGRGILRKPNISTEALVDALYREEKELNKSIAPTPLEPYKFLKLMLERNIALGLNDEVFLLGVKRDKSGLSYQKDTIAIQAAAQVLWFMEKNKIPTIAKMVKSLLEEHSLLYKLLKLDRFELDSDTEKPYSRTIAGYVSDVFPVLDEFRRGHPSKTPIPNNWFDDLIPIPGIFLEGGKMINFQKLKFVIKCITRVLRTFSWELNRIKESNFIHLYQNPLLFYPYTYVSDWVDEAFVENGSIFDQ